MNIGPVVVLAIWGLLGKKFLDPCRVPSLLEYIAHIILHFDDFTMFTHLFAQLAK